ncbi:MAG: FIG01128929: hypothetical protein [uncultured Nocardioidaceae bacterium]|uniref:DUF5063 domain-containing protein n=1 Tax=uncultured Nocardioidaceae bacterium TaxID=253824 RepID=A0A6J4MF54_9ACTN|nr:MAG: FIG01128929: hypothetical protein [uncultured Nocardioidaceae bacterium]
MVDTTGDLTTSPQAELSPELEEFAQQIADQVESFLIAVRAIARGEASGGQAISLLLLVVSQVLLAGGRLGVQEDFQPTDEYEPDPGPDPDLDDMRLRLAVLLEGVDAYTEVFDPYVDPPELVSSLLSDELTSIASALAHGLRHHKAGRVAEALWWWQFSYVASWGGEASAALRALQSVVAHDRLDAEFQSELEDVAAAEQMLGSAAD